MMSRADLPPATDRGDHVSTSMNPPDDPDGPGVGGYQSPPGAPPPGSPPYGQPAYGQPPMTYGAPGATLAEWPMRVGAYLIDTACIFGIYLVGFVIGLIASQLSNALGAVVLVLTYLGAIGFLIWQLVVQGQTGQTIGKEAVKIRLVAEATGQPVGPGLSIGRQFVHVLDSIPCFVGYLWPLWDVKKQTFADKLLHTVVVQSGG